MSGMSRVGEIEAPKRATIDKNTVTYRQVSFVTLQLALE